MHAKASIFLLQVAAEFKSGTKNEDYMYWGRAGVPVFFYSNKKS